MNYNGPRFNEGESGALDVGSVATSLVAGQRR